MGDWGGGESCDDWDEEWRGGEGLIVGGVRGCLGEGSLVEVGVGEREEEGRKNWVIGVWERGWERGIEDEGVGVGVRFLVLEERLGRVRYRGEGSRLLFAGIWWRCCRIE